MGSIRYRRRLRLAPGMYLNVGKGSASVSVGGRGHWVTSGTRGSRATVGIPGTGLYYTTRSHPRRAAPAKAEGGAALALGCIGNLIVLFLGYLVVNAVWPK